MAGAILIVEVLLYIQMPFMTLFMSYSEPFVSIYVHPQWLTEPQTCRVTLTLQPSP